MNKILWNDVTTLGKTIRAIRWPVVITVVVIILDGLVRSQDSLDPRTAAVVSALYPIAVMIQGVVDGNQPNVIPPARQGGK